MAGETVANILLMVFGPVPKVTLADSVEEWLSITSSHHKKIKDDMKKRAAAAEEDELMQE